MLDTVIQQAFNALQLGSYYSLIALGYCLVYGVLLLINFAHGDIFMVGAYIAFFAATYIMGQHALIPPNSPIMVKLVFAGFFALIVTAAVSFAIKKKPLAAGQKDYRYPAILGGIFITVTAAIY